MSEQARYLTYMFCDLVDSTALTHDLGDPEAAFELIHSFQHACAQQIEEYQGFVARYMGDAVLAYFGYPVALECSSEAAVRCALSLREQVKAMDERLGLRVGIANGRGVLGELHMGSGNAEVAVVSEATNLAARLEAQAQPGEILVSQQVYEEVQGFVSFAEPREVELKGYEGTQLVYAVTGYGDYLSASHLAGEQGEAQFIGRKRQLRSLLRYWSQAKSGKGCSVLLHGEAGIGKTSLARQLRQRLEGDGLQVKLFTSQFERHTALYPLKIYFESLWAEAGETAFAQWLTDCLGPGDHAVHRETVGLLLGRIEPPPMLPNLLRERILQGLVDLLLQLARQQPLLILLEDMHWVDASTGELLARTRAAANEVPLYLLATSRMSADLPVDIHWDSRVDLGRLDPADADALLAALDVDNRLNESLRLRIAEKANGVPLLLKEFTRSTLAAVGEAQAGSQPAAMTDVVIPDNLLQSFLAQIDPWSSVREVIDVAAAIGHGFYARLIAQTLSVATEVVEQALSQLTENGLLVAYAGRQGQAFNFSHALLGDAAYSTLLRKQRRQIHEKVLTAWRELEPACQQTQPSQIAHHLIGIGDFEAAVTVLLKAAQQRFRASQFAESAGLVNLAIDLLSHIEDESVEETLALQAYTLQGLALTQTRGFGDSSVSEAYSRAWRICQTLHRTGESEFMAIWGIWSNKLVVSDTRLAVELTDKLTVIAEQAHSDDLKLLALAANTVMAYCTANFHQIEPQLTQVMDSYDRAQHAGLALSYSMDPKAIALLFACHASAALGDLERSAWARAEAVAHITDLGLDFLQPYTNVFSLGAAVYHQADEALVESLSHHMAIAEELGQPFWVISGSLWKGAALVQMGQLQEGMAILEASLAQADMIGLSLTVAYHRSVYAAALAEMGRQAEAMPMFQRCIDSALTSGEICSLAETRRLYGLALLRAGDTKHARQELEKGLVMAREQAALGWEGRLVHSLAEHDLLNMLSADARQDFRQRMQASPAGSQDWSQPILALI